MSTLILLDLRWPAEADTKGRERFVERLCEAISEHISILECQHADTSSHRWSFGLLGGPVAHDLHSIRGLLQGAASTRNSSSLLNSGSQVPNVMNKLLRSNLEAKSIVLLTAYLGEEVSQWSNLKGVKDMTTLAGQRGISLDLVQFVASQWNVRTGDSLFKLSSFASDKPNLRVSVEPFNALNVWQVLGKFRQFQGKAIQITLPSPPKQEQPVSRDTVSFSKRVSFAVTPNKSTDAVPRLQSTARLCCSLVPTSTEVPQTDEAVSTHLNQKQHYKLAGQGRASAMSATLPNHFSELVVLNAVDLSEMDLSLLLGSPYQVRLPEFGDSFDTVEDFKDELIKCRSTSASLFQKKAGLICRGGNNLFLLLPKQGDTILFLLWKLVTRDTVAIPSPNAVPVLTEEAKQTDAWQRMHECVSAIPVLPFNPMEHSSGLEHSVARVLHERKAVQSSATATGAFSGGGKGKLVLTHK